MSCQNSAYILHRVFYLILFSSIELFILLFYCGLVSEVLSFMLCPIVLCKNMGQFKFFFTDMTSSMKVFVCLEHWAIVNLHWKSHR